MQVYASAQQRGSRPSFTPAHTSSNGDRSVESGHNAESNSADSTDTRNSGPADARTTNTRSDAQPEPYTKRESDANAQPYAESIAKRQPDAGTGSNNNTKPDAKSDPESQPGAAARLIGLMRAICVICVSVGHR